MLIKENPVFKRMFELGEEQVGKIAQQLMSNERFVNAIQALVTNSFKAKGVFDKNLRLALSAANLPSVDDVEGLRKKLEDLEVTIRKLEESLASLSAK